MLKYPRPQRKSFASLAVVLLLVTLTASPAFGETIGPDWNYANKSGFGAYCSKGSIQAPGYSQASGRGWSWTTVTPGDCDAAKYTGWNRVATDLGYMSGGSWVSCKKETQGWTTTAYRIATAVNGPCPGGHTFYTLTVPSSCIYSDCRSSGATCTGPGGSACTALNLFPLVSPGQYWS